MDTDAVLEEFNDPVIARIEEAIAIHFYSEMLSKCLQLIENEWVKENGESVLVLYLMADWLIQVDHTVSSTLPMKCFTLLREEESASRLQTLMVEREKQAECENVADEQGNVIEKESNKNGEGSRTISNTDAMDTDELVDANKLKGTCDDLTSASSARDETSKTEKEDKCRNINHTNKTDKEAIDSVNENESSTHTSLK